MQTLQKVKEPREDYRQFLDLVIIFLGGTPPRGISFRGPGAFHHARWMAKAICSLKIDLFRDMFTLTNEEKIGIRDICIFLAKLYLKVSIQAPMTAKAPRLEFEFLKNVYAYRQGDEKISHIAINKLCNHLWYLAPETAVLAFFDKVIGCDTKKRMVEALDKIDTSENSAKKFEIFPNDAKKLLTKVIENFML